MGFLADGADNPISNPSALEITRVVFEHRRSLRAVLTLRRDLGPIMAAARLSFDLRFILILFLTFDVPLSGSPAEAINVDESNARGNAAFDTYRRER